MPTLKFDAMADFADAREMPAYGIPIAAHYLRIPESTLRYWVHGRNCKGSGGPYFVEPVIQLPGNAKHLLSFFNLAEAHVPRSFRIRHEIKLQAIRTALDYVEKTLGTPHPLVNQKFKTDGAGLFVEQLGHIVDASGGGQRVMADVMMHLERLDFHQGVATRLWPFTHSIAGPTSPKSVFIDARYAFGRPVVAGIVIPTAVIAERYKAGESVVELAKDYECKQLDIDEAIRCELVLDQAA